MIDLVELFCHVDDFCQRFMPVHKKTLLGQRVKRHRTRKCSLSTSEIMTIILYFYHSNYRDFKHYYLNYVCRYLKRDFPRLVSYNRFIELKRRVIIPMCAYLQSRQYPSSEINFVDSTCVKVCHNRRISRHKTLSRTQVIICINKRRYYFIYGVVAIIFSFFVLFPEIFPNIFSPHFA